MSFIECYELEYVCKFLVCYFGLFLYVCKVWKNEICLSLLLIDIVSCEVVFNDVRVFDLQFIYCFVEENVVEFFVCDVIVNQVILSIFMFCDLILELLLYVVGILFFCVSKMLGRDGDIFVCLMMLLQVLVDYVKKGILQVQFVQLLFVLQLVCYLVMLFGSFMFDWLILLESLCKILLLLQMFLLMLYDVNSEVLL